jgi:hypothetical protein
MIPVGSVNPFDKLDGILQPTDDLPQVRDSIADSIGLQRWRDVNDGTEIRRAQPATKSIPEQGSEMPSWAGRNPFETGLREFATAASTSTDNALAGAMRATAGQIQSNTSLAKEKLAGLEASLAKAQETGDQNEIQMFSRDIDSARKEVASLEQADQEAATGTGPLDKIRRAVRGFDQGAKEALQKGAEFFTDKAKSDREFYDTKPNDTSASAQVGRGLGSVASMTPTMVVPGGAGLAIVALQGASASYNEAYEATREQLQKAGVSDEKTIDDASSQAGSTAATKTFPALAAYMVGGKITAAGVSALLKGAAPLVKGIVGGTAAAGANVITSAGIRTAEGEDWRPTIEGTTQDVAFGAIHGAGEYNQAKVTREQEAQRFNENPGQTRSFPGDNSQNRQNPVGNAPKPPQDPSKPAADGNDWTTATDPEEGAAQTPTAPDRQDAPVPSPEPTRTEPPIEQKITPTPSEEAMQKHGLAWADPKTLKLSEDVPNFKEGADEKTGIVEADRLKGKYDPEAAGILHVWERLDGKREIISGRHRWQLALENNTPEVLVKIHREADGFTKEDALTKDAQLNIKDEKGTTKDFAAYFRNDPITREEAEAGGLLSRVKQKAGFEIGRYSSGDLYGLFSAGKISEAKAAAIARTAPNNDGLQRAGMDAAGRMSAEEIPGFLKLLEQSKGPQEVQAGLFGDDDSAIQDSIRISKAAAKKAEELQEQILAVKGASKRPEAAAKLGVNVKDPEGLQNKILDLSMQRERYRNFWQHPEIIQELSGKATAPEEAAAIPEATTPTIERNGEGNLFGEEEMPFNLSGEVDKTSLTPEEQRAKALDEAMAAENEQNQGSLFDEPKGGAKITGDSIKAFHGSRSNERFSAFSEGRDGFTYFTSDKKSAERYANPMGRPEKTAGVYGVSLKIQNPKIYRESNSEEFEAFTNRNITLEPGRDAAILVDKNGNPTDYAIPNSHIENIRITGSREDGMEMGLDVSKREQAPEEVTPNTRTISRDYNGYPKGTQVEIIGKASKDPLSTELQIRFPDGKTDRIPEAWLKKPKTAGTKPKQTLPQLLKEKGRDAVNELLGEWNDAELSADGTYIMGVVDPRSSMKPERIPVREFLDWLQDKESKPSETPTEEAKQTGEISEEYDSLDKSIQVRYGETPLGIPEYRQIARAFMSGELAPESGVRVTLKDGTEFDGVMKESQGMPWISENGSVRLSFYTPEHLESIESIRVTRSASDAIAEKLERKYGEIAYTQPETREDYERTLKGLATQIRKAREESEGGSNVIRYLQLEAQFDKVADEIQLAKNKRAYIKRYPGSYADGIPFPTRPWKFNDAADQNYAIPKPSDFDPDPEVRKKRSAPHPGNSETLAQLNNSIQRAESDIYSKRLSGERKARLERIIERRKEQIEKGDYYEKRLEAWNKENGTQETNPEERDSNTEESGKPFPTTKEEVQSQLDSLAKKKGLEDFGEKIGGARKDTATKGGRGTSKPQDDRPGWARRYELRQIVSEANSVIKDGVKSTEIDPLSKGRWVVVDLRNLDWRKQPKQVGRDSYATREEAEQIVPLIAVARNHSARMVSRGEEKPVFQIWRKVTDRKLVQVVKEDFPTREAAMEYMAKNAKDIIEAKTAWREELIVKPENAVRTGTERRQGPATPEMFQDTFGFRGVEFGNWMKQDTGSKERQEVLNNAFDGLKDLAEILGVPDKALSLNGDLGLAFGARGQGLVGAKAHYEPEYGVINLTKMSGAGSLAHEWFHAFDHYLARLDSKASGSREANDTGDLTYKTRGYVSEGFSGKSQVRPEVMEAFNSLIKTMRVKAVNFVEDSKKAEDFVAKKKGDLANKLVELRRNLTSELQYGSKKAPATAKQLAKFDELAGRLLEGADVKTEYRYEANPKRKFSGKGRWSNDTLDALSDLWKEVRGRSGFKSDNSGVVNGLYSYVKNYHERIEMLKSASQEEVKTKAVPTSYRMESAKIDQGSATDYWQTELELAARAFSSYVEDKIANGGARSEFLSYGSDNELPGYKMWGLKPFPEGEERLAINAAMDRLFRTLKTKETEKGVSFFSMKEGQEKQPFYSQLQRTIEAKMPNRASVEQIRAIIDPAKGSGVKPDEVKWSNLEGFLEGKASVTKQEVLDYLRNEGSVKFEERTIGGKETERVAKEYGFTAEYDPSLEEYTFENKDGEQVEYGELPFKMRYDLDRISDGGNASKYAQYALPNGENYREVVLTMPVSDPRIKRMDELKKLPHTEENIAEYSRLSKETNGRSSVEYTSSHFPDIPNYVAHMRLNERQDSTGKDGLFIEEIQSDRHQKGREKGYQGEPVTGYQVVVDGNPAMTYATKEEAQAHAERAKQHFSEDKIQIKEVITKQQQANESGKIPDAPFRKDWHVQMFKRALRDAIEGDKEWIGWTSGETQAGRYDLSKKVSEVRYNPEHKYFQAWKRNLDSNVYQEPEIERKAEPKELEDLIGKDLAKKLVAGTPDGAGWVSIKGQDLKVGGEGMKGFYDNILPKEIGKYVKKWGAKVEEGKIGQSMSKEDMDMGDISDATPEELAQLEAQGMVTGPSVKIWKVAITPEMRESIQNEGQSFFSTKEELAELTKIADPDISSVDERDTRLVGRADAARAISILERKLEEEAKSSKKPRTWRVASGDYHDVQDSPQIALANAVARLFGRELVVFKEIGNAPNGIVNGSLELRRFIFLNEASDKPVFLTLGHELWHIIHTQAPILAESLRRELRPMMNIGSIREAKGLYDAYHHENEAIGDLLGDMLSDPRRFNDLAQRNKSLARKVVSAVQKWLSKVSNALKNAGYGSNKFFRDIEEARDRMADVLAKFSEAPFSDHGEFVFEPRESSESYYSKKQDRLLAAMDRHNAAPPLSMREKVASSMRRIKGVTKDLPEFGDFKREVLKWSSRSQRSANEILRVQSQIEEAVPSKEKRDGITNFIQANGDQGLLRSWANATKNKALKAGYEAALTLTPEEIATAKKIKDTYDVLHARAAKFGIDMGYLPNYVTELWKQEPQRAAGSSPKRLSDFFKFSQERVFPNYFEGEQAGYEPQTKDISKLLGLYMNEMNNAINSRRFVQELSKGTASDGRPLVSARGSGQVVGEEIGDKVHLVYPDKAAEGTEDYKKLDQPALHGWVFAGKDADGNMIMVKGDLAVHPEIASRFKNALGSSKLRQWWNEKTENPFLNATKGTAKFILDDLQGAVKGTMLSFSPFHQVQEGIHALGHRINPFGNIPKIDLRRPDQMDAVEHGLMLSHDRLSQHLFMEGVGTNNRNLVTGLIRKVGFKPGRLAADRIDAYQDWLFGHYIPGLKFKTYEHILDRNMERYAKDLASGKANQDQVKLLSARQANAAYGHLNYTDMGHNPTIRHAFQVVLLAPDFLEARARFTGQAIKGLAGGKVGSEQLQALAFLAVTQFVLARVLNKLQNDDYEWGHPFEVKVGNKLYGLRSVPEDIYKLFGNTAGFIGGRISPIFGRLIQEGLFGVNYRGEHTTWADALTDIVSGVVPMPFQFLTKDIAPGGRSQTINPMEQILSATGLQVHRYSPISATYQLARKWTDANDPDDAKARGRYPVSKYQGLRYALEDGDFQAAKAEMRKLQAKGQKLQDIREGFKTSVDHPFTGTKLNDIRFERSLAGHDKEIFKAAVERRKAILQRFGQALR